MATDPIIKDHQLWIGFVQPEGLVVSPAALKNAQAVLSRNVGVQQEILRRAGQDYDALKHRAQTPGFTPIALGALRGSVTLHTQIQNTHSYNVVGVLPGTQAPSEAVILILPAATPVANPVDEIVALEVSELVQAT